MFAPPLAAEPYAAALDLVSHNGARTLPEYPAIALLRSSHFRFAASRDVSALDRALAEAGYLGGVGLSSD
jgi:hypothetical protein